MKRSLEPTIATLRMYNVGLGMAQRLARAYYMAERNSKQREIEFNLSVIDLARLAQRSRGRCEVTDLAFEFIDTSRKWERQPWTPSIDRVDCTRGYVFDNCRLVCASVNVALNSWGETVLDRIAEAILVKKLRHVEGYRDYLLNLDKKIKRRNRYLRTKWVA